MANKKKFKLGKKLYTIFMITFLCSVSMYVSTSYNTYSEFKAQENELAKKIEAEQERQVSLNNKLELYKSDAYIEKIAKDMGYIKSNEVIYISEPK